MADGPQCASLLIPPTILLQRYHRACLWSRRIFHRDELLNCFYSRSHAFATEDNTIQYNTTFWFSQEGSNSRLLHLLVGVRCYLVDHWGDEIEGQNTTCVANSAADCHPATSVV